MEGKLTRSSLLDLFGSHGKCRQQCYHYLNDHILQCFLERDLGINIKSAEEMLDRFEQVYESIVASTKVLRRLVK